MHVSSGERHSHDRLLPFGHSQKQIAGWASGLIMLVRGCLIVATQQNRAELFGLIIIIITEGLCSASDTSLTLILRSFLAQMWSKLHIREPRCWSLFFHLLLVFLYFPFNAQSYSTEAALNVVLSLYCNRFSGWEAKVQIDSCHSGWNSKGRRPVSTVLTFGNPASCSGRKSTSCSLVNFLLWFHW